MPEKCEAREELRWSPGVADCDLMMYLRAARSMAAFAGMCDGGSAEDGCIAASRDDTTINAMDLLHESCYDTGRALQALVKNPIPPGVEKKWSEDDQKRFVKGLRQYGKNFFKIRKELLSHKETADLVEFYYLWKKSPGAITSRTHRRNRRQSTLRRNKPSPVKPNRPVCNNNFVEGSSGSEEGEESEEEEENKESSGLSCQNCSSKSSKDWHPVESLTVVCSVCRLFYKKHGMLPTDSKENLTFLFQPVKEEDEDGTKHAMRTRRSKERQSPKTVVTEGGVKIERKSPGFASNGSSGSIERDKKKDSSPKGKKRIKEEKVEGEEAKAEEPKKRSRPDSPSEYTESSVSNEEVPVDPSSSPSPSASPVPSPNPDSQAEIEPEIPPEPVPVAMEVDPPATTEEEIISPVTPEPVVEVKQEIIINEDPEPPVIKTEPVNPPEELDSSEKAPELPQPINYAPSPVQSPSCFAAAADEPPTVNESPVFEEPEPMRYTPPPNPPEQPDEEALPPPTISNPHHYPGPTPQSIKMEPVELAASPPPPAIQHEPVHHPHPYPPTSSTALFSNSLTSNISIAMGNNSHSVSGSISASSSISLSYHNHSKMPYPGHSTLIATSHHSQSAFNYRPFSPQYPYAPALGYCVPPVPHMPPQPLKHKYNSPNTPPPTSSPYGTASPQPPDRKSENFPRSSSQSSSMQSPPVTTHSSSSSTHSSSKSPMSYSGQKMAPQPAHQSSIYPQMGPMKSSHSLPRPHAQTGMPTPSQHLPPTAYVGNLPPHMPPERQSEPEKCSVIQEPVPVEEEEEIEPHYSFRGPSPEPRVEDVECHRSQSAIFLRHWNRGEFNSCARTDLTFKPVPETKLARKREERARKAAEKEREETKARLGSTPDNKPGSQPEHHLSPFDRVGPRSNPDTPALRQLSEYARPHAAAGFPPGYARPGQPLLPHGIDPIVHYQLTSGMYGAAARESYRLEIEMEREKRERELHDKLKADYEMKARAGASYDPHWIELQRRYAMQQGAAAAQAAAHHQFNLYGDRERMPNVPTSEALERMNAERAHMLGQDPLLRLQMAGLAPELHTHAHTHAHAHTHLHLHPHDAVSAAAAAAAAMGVPPGMEQAAGGAHPLLPPSGYAGGGPRAGLVSRAELMHPAAAGGMLRPPYDEQFAHQISAQIAQHEHLQRQLLMERERYAHMGGPMSHPSPLMSQHEEFLRQQQQREREIKLRNLEEAARGGRPPMN